MGLNVITTAGGASALDALADSVARRKGDDPLAPVAVIVPTNTAGVMARRGLGRRGGAAAIDVLTLFRVAELLGAPTMRAASRLPVSTPIVDLAVRHSLTDSPGTFRAVAEHPSTIAALRDLYRDLRVAGPAALDAIGRTERGAEPARVLHHVAARLRSGWYDEGDLIAAAIDAVRAGRSERFARTALYLPQRLRPLERQLVQALGRAGALDVIVAVTGHTESDRPALDLVTNLRGDTPGPPRPSGRSAAPTGLDPLDVIETTDADDEVRIAMRTVVDHARHGMRFDRIAILWPSDRPYARIVEHHLRSADIPWNGRPGTKSAERQIPRLLSELLDIDRRGLRRGPLMTLLSEIPARLESGHRTPSARWERITRAAGVVREEDWSVRLPSHAAGLRDLIARGTDDDDERLASAARRAERELPDVEQLGAFVDELRRRLGPIDERRSWRDWAAWSLQTLDWWYGSSQINRLTDAERAAFEQVQSILDRLGHLDKVGGRVTRHEFRATFVAELDVAPPRRGTVGDGVYAGTLAGAGGLDADAVVLLGVADGVLPPRPSPDPLLNEADRSAAGLATNTDRLDHVHHLFRVIATTTPHVTITVPRGDLRTTSIHYPSRWLPDITSRQHRPVQRDSHTQSLSITKFPVTEHEHRLRELWTAVRSGIDMRSHILATADRALARAITMRDARAGTAFTEYDGNLSTRSIAPVGQDHPVAPTRLEAWASCPFAYFMKYVLGVYPVEDPAEQYEISPLDRGSAFHEILDRLHRDVIAGRLVQPGPDGWSDVHHRRLVEIADDVFTTLERAGKTGRPAYWAIGRPAAVTDLMGWARSDAALWNGRTVIASEAHFGADGAVTVGLGDGRQIAFAGSIDRIDEMRDGSLVVTDHKTGSAASYEKFDAADPTQEGARFQLPVYALAARHLTAAPAADVTAEYSFFAKGNYKRLGLRVDDTVLDAVADEVKRVVDAIAAGMFFAAPDAPGYRHYVRCQYCEPDGLGPGDRWPEHVRKRADPNVTRWLWSQDGGE